ncbi:MAG: hypothetical protein SH856_02415 [Flavobacteriales bacterium]|nr:hypothetical protein [Flavobacteriales bacterium]
MEQIAVITGDIAGFTRMNQKKRDKCLDDLKRCFEVLKEYRKQNSLRGNPEIFRGDSFQLVLTKPTNALAVVLQLKTFLVFEIKLSVGIGTSSPLKRRSGESDGEAFHLSGRTLDEMKYSTVSTSFKTTSNELNDELETHCYLLEGMTSRWTIVQKDVLFYKLIGYTETEIAEVLHISQPTVNAHSKAANWKAVERLQKRFSNIVSSMK